MSDPLGCSQESIIEAAAWMARMRAEDRSESDIRAFQAWFAADIGNFRAFEHMNELWDATGSYRGAAPRAIGKNRASLTRRGLVATMGATLLAAGGVAYWKSGRSRTFVTDVGEQKHIALEDGSRIFLDTDTCCAVEFTGSARAVNLLYGRANFRILSDARPFSVEAGSHRVRTQRSQFDVRRDQHSSKLSVTQIEGQAQLENWDADRRVAVKEIAAGQQAVLEGAGDAVITKADLVRMLAWQRGQANFENTRLDSAIAEMNRYSTRKIMLGPGIADLRISGVYGFGDNHAFAGAASQVLPIRIVAERTGGAIELVADNTPNRIL